MGMTSSAMQAASIAGFTVRVTIGFIRHPPPRLYGQIAG
jgi:hypothetical protein